MLFAELYTLHDTLKPAGWESLSQHAPQSESARPRRKNLVRMHPDQFFGCAEDAAGKPLVVCPSDNVNSNSFDYYFAVHRRKKLSFYETMPTLCEHDPFFFCALETLRIAEVGATLNIDFSVAGPRMELSLAFAIGRLGHEFACSAAFDWFVLSSL